MTTLATLQRGSKRTSKDAAKRGEERRDPSKPKKAEVSTSTRTVAKSLGMGPVVRATAVRTRSKPQPKTPTVSGEIVHSPRVTGVIEFDHWYGSENGPDGRLLKPGMRLYERLVAKHVMMDTRSTFLIKNIEALSPKCKIEMGVVRRSDLPEAMNINTRMVNAFHDNFVQRVIRMTGMTECPPETAAQILLSGHSDWLPKPGERLIIGMAPIMNITGTPCVFSIVNVGLYCRLGVLEVQPHVIWPEDQGILFAKHVHFTGLSGLIQAKITDPAKRLGRGIKRLLSKDLTRKSRK